jgi:Cys-rich protein (TIGR01571 family)
MSFMSLVILLYYANYGTSVAMEYVTSSTVDLILAIVGATFALGIGFIIWLMRYQYRRDLAIAGTQTGDCAAAFCCSCCSLVQMAAEVDLENISIVEEPLPFQATT